MNNNCTCRTYNEKFLIVFHETEPERWQLIESWMGIWKRDLDPKHDNLIQKKSIWNTLTVSPDYEGCPNCKAKGIFICTNCYTVNCCDPADAPVARCAVCHTDGVLTNIQEAGVKKDK